ncbi:NmrA/HSCARG family protein [Streptomyces sp. NPDC058534]|uniref:NmrA/HSCARG family protein n=1 Tax=Streptomyces sp. NPDC058534 TaxID=3346541 RepID=UPI003663FBD7
MDKKTVLVTGATGGQGGAVARALLSSGWAVRALVRTPDTQQAQDLKALGAELATGDLNDAHQVTKAAQGAYGIFSVQGADLVNPQPKTEITQGRNVADAAKAAGVHHLVYSSVAAVGKGSGVTHFDTKAEIEDYITSLSLPATVLRPVFFMENWAYMLPKPAHGTRTGPFALDADTTLQMIALSDIGRIAADVFANPGEFTGKTIEIAGDELSVAKIAEVFTVSDDIPTFFTRLPSAKLRADSQELGNMFDWLNATGYQANIKALRERHPGLLTLQAWLAAK